MHLLVCYLSKANVTSLKRTPVSVKVKQSYYMPGGAQRPGGARRVPES